MVPEGQYLLGDLECDLTPPQEALLQDLLNGFDPEAGGNASLNTQLDALSKARRLRLKPDTAEKICRLAFLELEGFGMFSPLLADDDLEEIAVVGVNMPVFVCHRIHGWMATNAVVQSAPYLAEVINKMARPLGRRLTFENPRLSAVLADGSRLHACFSPIAKDGFVMNLRKFRRKRITLTELLATDFLDVPSAAFLNAVMISDASVLIAGNTASGKTTFLNALSEFVPEKERVVVLEESPELFWPHAHQVRLVASVSASLGQLVADSLRLRPDRVVVGEVRTSEETRALFDVLLSGHARGAYGTFHA
ncbi:MAG TPA: ATPase, T2SS/T4P/T4SS family, partial [Candidatus Norongarragalinales archaeon]|nr:ATPase, T2SS/T4P/T4SS family [Candidatus Norongarragalinales archaeon]